MLYQIVIAAGLMLCLGNVLLNLRSLKVPRPDAPVPYPAPMVSVLIPARDEQSNIRACVESLQKQDYPNLEVLVLDDNSDDNTASIVREIAAADPRVKLFNGESLPDDWAGKPYACHQLAWKAKGDWFLFVDADTTHAPNMVRSVLDTAKKLKVSLLTGFPRQLGGSLAQKIAVPVIYFVIIGWAPLWLVHRLRKPRPSVAIGQFMLFPRNEYWRIGGHRAVQNRILDDIWMGIEVSRHGGRHVAVDLSDVVSCNMYPTAGSMWNGLVRCIYSVSVLSPWLLLFLLPIAWLFYMGPFYWLWHGFFMSDASILWRGVVGIQVALVFFMRWLVDSRFKESAAATWLHLLGIGYLMLAVVYALARWITGSGVTWKERVYGEEESVVK
jgi:chlorobactene glucosyltransferase